MNSDNIKTLSKLCIIFISINCALTLPAKYSDHSIIVDTINRLQEIKGENFVKLYSDKWSSVTSSTHFAATSSPENKQSGNVMLPVIIGSVLGGIVALYLIYLLLLLSVVTWTCILQRLNFHQYVELIE